MNAALITSDVLFDIATASYPWGSGGPLLGLGLLSVVVFGIVAWVVCDDLPEKGRQSLQRLCICCVLIMVGVMLSGVTLYKIADWQAFCELRLQRERGPLTVIEGEFVFDNSYFIAKEPWQRADGGRDDPPVFWIVVSKGERHEERHEFAWDIAPGYTARPVALSINKKERLRVSFVSNPTNKTQRALRIAKIAAKH